MATTPITGANRIDDRAPASVFVGICSAPCGSQSDDQTITETYYGDSEAEVVAEMVREFASTAFDKHPAASCLQTHVDLEAVMGRFGISPARAREVASTIRTADADNLKAFSSYFTNAEIIRGYSRLNPDERVEVVQYNPSAISTFNHRKPNRINVIYYDTVNGMAIARDVDDLFGFYPLENATQPHPDDYDWSNGFDFEFLSPDQAEALTKIGHGDIVEKFASMGVVCEG